MLKKVMKALLVSGIYFGWAILFYCLREGWRPIDAIYFAMVTMSTVGYGDFSPKDEPGAMVNTVFFIFFGIVFVFSEVSSCVAMLMAPFFKVRRWREPRPSVKPEADGKACEEHRRLYMYVCE